MTRDEAAAQVREANANARENAWNLMRQLGRATPQQLRAAGYGAYTNDGAIAKVFRDTLAENEARVRQRERRYPDVD